MTIAYLANIRFPTEKAHGAQIAKTCEALGKLTRLTLVVSDRATPIPGDAFAYYGVEPTFRLLRVRVLDLVQFGPIGFLLETLSFCLGVLRVLREESWDGIYGRDEWVLAFVCLMTGRRVVWESHVAAENSAARFLLTRAAGIVCISEGIREQYRAEGVPEKKLLVAHDGLSLEPFMTAQSREAARKRLDLPEDRTVALYVGRLDAWKGVRTFFEAARELPSTTLAAVMGGEDDERVALAKEYPAVQFLGARPYAELPHNLAAADILVLPNTATNVVSASYTSPLKLFAYLAAGKPIVASDVPSVREVLDESMAYFVPADNPTALAAALVHIREVPEEAAAKAARAKEMSIHYSWGARASRIHTFLTSL